MEEYQGKRLARRIVYSRAFLVLILVLVALALRAVWGVFWRSRTVEEERARAAEELRALQERQAELESELAKLETERGIEEEIRRKYSVVKPGEGVIVVVEQNATSAVPLRDESWSAWLKPWWPFAR